MAKKDPVTETGVTLNGQYKIEQVPALLEAVVAKLKALKGGETESGGTNGELEQFGNINNEEDPARLIKAFSAVSGRADAYAKAVKAMKLPSGAPAFEINGFSAAAWKKDIIKRYHVVTKAKEIAKLTAIKNKLNKYQTEEQQFNTDMGDIADLLAGG